MLLIFTSVLSYNYTKGGPMWFIVNTLTNILFIELNRIFLWYKYQSNDFKHFLHYLIFLGNQHSCIAYNWSVDVTRYFNLSQKTANSETRYVNFLLSFFLVKVDRNPSRMRALAKGNYHQYWRGFCTKNIGSGENYVQWRGNWICLRQTCNNFI